MRKLIFALTLVFITFVGCETAGDEKLVGDWELIEFGLVGVEGHSTRDEDNLRKAGAVWDIEFSRGGDFKQTFNMRRQDKKMEVEEGTWQTVGDTLKIELHLDSLTSKLNYNYVINDDVLTLSLSPGEVDAKLVTKFREK